MAEAEIKENENYDGSTPLQGRYAVIQEAFLDNILSGMVQFEAYKKAGYKPKNDKTALACSSRVLTKANIKARLAYKQNEIAKASGITAQKVVKAFAEIGFCDPAEVIDETNGQIKDIHVIPINIRRAISSIEVIEEFSGKGENKEFIGFTKKIRFWDKNKALESLAKHLGLFAEDNSQKAIPIPMVLIIGGDSGRKPNTDNQD